MNRERLDAYGEAQKRTEEILRGWRSSLLAAQKMCAAEGIAFSSRAKITLLCSKVLALVLQDVQECQYKQLEPRDDDQIIKQIAQVIEEVENDIEKDTLHDDDFDTYLY